MQNLDDSLDFAVSLRPDCKPLSLIPGENQQDFAGGTERALGCLPAYGSMLRLQALEMSSSKNHAGWEGPLEAQPQLKAGPGS